MQHEKKRKNDVVIHVTVHETHIVIKRKFKKQTIEMLKKNNKSKKTWNFFESIYFQIEMEYWMRQPSSVKGIPHANIVQLECGYRGSNFH